ncbi:MAG: dihydrofolate reductase [Gemmatimonadales bacterium]
MIVSLVAAVAENGVIGRENDLPWHLPDDLRRFKAMTTGHTVIMGRKTWQSVGKPLPERRCIVVSRNPRFHPAGVEVARDLPAALALARPAELVFVLGGGELYRAALPVADRLELTVVHARVPGDTTFPDFEPADWVLTAERFHPADERHEHSFTFRTYERVERRKDGKTEG